MAYMEEDLMELPTFVISISKSKSLELGKGFHIEHYVSIEGINQGYMNLTQGDNAIAEANLSINLDGWPNDNGGEGLKFGDGWNSFRLTPLNSPKGLLLDYFFTFIFEDATAVEKSAIIMAFRSKNGILLIAGACGHTETVPKSFVGYSVMIFDP